MNNNFPISTDVNMTYSQRALIVLVYFAVFWIALPSILFLIGFRLDYLFPLAFAAKHSLEIWGWLLTAAGSIITLGGMLQLRLQGEGLPISHLPPEKFVASGLYRIFRHPIYVGYTLLFLGVSLNIGSEWSALFSTPLLILGWTAYAVFYEERDLINRFGERYLEYRVQTPLLFPKAVERVVISFHEKLAKRLKTIWDYLADSTILFRFGSALFVTYGALIAFGSLLFMTNTGALLIGNGFSFENAAWMISGSALFGMFFGRFFWWLGHARELRNEPLRGLRKVGYVSFGDLTGIVVFPAVYSFFNDLNFMVIADAYAAGMFIAYSIGRIGCLTYGCCYGNECEHDGVFYKNEHSKVIREKGAQRKTRYPTQVFSAMHGLVLFGILNLLIAQKLPAGTVAAAAFLLYPVGRMYIEFYRDRKRYFRGVLTDGHIGCLAMFSLGVILLFFIDPESSRTAGMWSASVFNEILPMIPLFVFLALLIFFVAGFHWKKVGSW